MAKYQYNDPYADPSTDATRTTEGEEGMTYAVVSEAINRTDESEAKVEGLYPDWNSAREEVIRLLGIELNREDKENTGHATHVRITPAN